MAGKIIDPFINIPDKPLQTVANHGANILRNVVSITAGGGDIIDAHGIVSINQFANGFHSSDTTIDDPGNNFVTIPGSTLSFTLRRQTNVQISFFAYAEVIGNAEDVAYTAQMCVSIDNVDQSPYAQLLYEMTTGAHGIRMGGNLSSSRIYTLTAGSHEIALRARGPSTYVRIGSRNLNYIILGK